MAVYSFKNINENNEITCYQTNRYIGSKEIIWQILTNIHLENGQSVYFNEWKTMERALITPKTTLTEFFNYVSSFIYGQFAKTLLYSEVPLYFT